jgi:predicted HicB family RNase H-like nuclease
VEAANMKKKKKKFKALSIRIPLELAKKLEIVAEQEHRSLNQQITYYLEKMLQTKNK